jgi:lipopolysaccharide export LptBFGC system permease protein LptF
MDIKTDEREARWRERERQWQKRLGRLRLGVEPLEDQLERYRRVAWALTIVPGIMAAMFVALFSAFHTPIVGLIVGGIVFGPIATMAWIDFKRMESRAAEFETERREFEVGSEMQAEGKS